MTTILILLIICFLIYHSLSVLVTNMKCLSTITFHRLLAILIQLWRLQFCSTCCLINTQVLVQNCFLFLYRQCRTLLFIRKESGKSGSSVIIDINRYIRRSEVTDYITFPYVIRKCVLLLWAHYVTCDLKIEWPSSRPL